MATVPNTTNFSLQDVNAVVGGGSLVSCFATAMDVSFDPTYKGSKNNLLNFRNYDSMRGVSLSISPSGTHAGTGSFILTITATAGLAWNCGSGSFGAWITVNGGSSANGTGNGSVTINVLARPTGGSGTTGLVSVVTAGPSASLTITRP